MTGAYTTATITGMVAVTDGANDVTSGAATTSAWTQYRCPTRDQFRAVVMVKVTDAVSAVTSETSVRNSGHSAKLKPLAPTANRQCQSSPTPLSIGRNLLNLMKACSNRHRAFDQLKEQMSGRNDFEKRRPCFGYYLVD